MSLQDVAVQLIAADEGFRSFAYDDATGDPIKPGYTMKGHVTVGFGACLEDGIGGLTVGEAITLRDNRIAVATGDAAYAVGAAVWSALDQNRQAALVDMAFTLGRPKLLGFIEMIRAVQTGDWKGAHAAALASLWAQKEAPGRAQRDASILLTGTLP